MNNIVAVNIEQIANDPNARFFLFFLQTEDGKIFAWRGNRYSEVIDGHNDASLFTKDNVVAEYYRALDDAREETQPTLFSGNGRLDVSVI